jgi:hypothetical protein
MHTPTPNRVIRSLLIVVVLAAAPSARAEIIDRVLAVVAKELIMLSDVSAAVRLGLVPAPVAGQDATRVALDALIARELELLETNRYQPPEPAAAQIEARLEAVRRRFPTAAALDTVLAQSGWTMQQLRLRIRDDLRIDAYLEQRFSASLQASDEDVVQYYRAHEPVFTRNGVLRPFVEVRDEARSRLLDEQRSRIIEEWLESLRRRADISDLYLTIK